MTEKERELLGICAGCIAQIALSRGAPVRIDGTTMTAPNFASFVQKMIGDIYAEAATSAYHLNPGAEMDHQTLHGQPAQFHIVAGEVPLATVSGFRDEDEALLWAQRHYPDVAEIAVSRALPAIT